jgi:FKBP-type peptidyl-prolyl cis-trans isomerase FkpA
MKNILFAFLILGLFTGCLKGDDNSNVTCTYNECAVVAPTTEIDAVRAYLAANSITATQHCSGMFYVIDNAGTGTAPTVCSNVAVTYEGKLTNGTTFDKSETPIVFNLSGLITGFKNGIPLIKTGGKIRLFIPPSLGYGPNPQGSIPGNSILIFEVTLVGVQ